MLVGGSTMKHGHSRSVRRRASVAVLGLGLLAAVSVAFPSAVRGDESDAVRCRPLLEAFLTNLKQYDSAAARDLVSDIDIFCPPKNRIAARAKLGLLVARIAEVEKDRGADSAGLYSEVESYLLFADHWALRTSLGALAMELKHYNEATQHYFRALDLIQNEGYTATAPKADVIRQVHEAASEALMLSEIPVKPTTRGGGTAAYFASNVRGISVPKKTPQITFITNSDEFDQPGRVTAERLLPILSRESPGEITIIGHTDERGDDAYNLELSGRRAVRIRAYLQENGFSGVVRTYWCGERVPVNMHDPGRFSQEERWRINRRVEVFYGQGNQGSERYSACSAS